MGQGESGQVRDTAAVGLLSLYSRLFAVFPSTDARDKVGRLDSPA